MAIYVRLDVENDVRLYFIEKNSGIILRKYGRYKKHHMFQSVEECKKFIGSIDKPHKDVKQFVIVKYTAKYDAKIVDVITV